MPISLLDLAPAEEHRETITVRPGMDIEIQPLDVTMLGRLCKRFPDLRKTLFAEEAPPDVQIASMLEAWPAIVAAGTGNFGDEIHEAAARRLPQQELMLIGGAIMRLSNPRPEAAGPLEPAAGNPGEAATESAPS
jgi:hypothetical protein